jgi:hypothetical protein
MIRLTRDNFVAAGSPTGESAPTFRCISSTAWCQCGPTFGISLEPEIERRDPVFLPVKYDQGYGERWNHFAEEKQGVSMLGGFISAIVSTMQNWNDNSLARMPGVRDRVARVRLNAKEGGMNLNMEARLIKNIAERGVQATKELFAAIRAVIERRAGGGLE